MTHELDKILDLEDLKELIILANTPLYLYKNFRKNSTVEELSNKYETQTLIEFFKKYTEEPEKDLNVLAIIYSFIIALSFKDYSETREFFSLLDTHKIHWLPELKNIIISKMMSTTIYEKNLGFKTDKFRQDIGSDSATTLIITNINDINAERDKK